MTTHVTDQSADRGSEQIEITVLLVLKTPTVTPSQQTFINSQFFFFHNHIFAGQCVNREAVKCKQTHQWSKLIYIYIYGEI